MDFDIEKIKRKMLVKYPFFGSVIANVDYKGTTEIETAATDGKVIYYNPEFLKKLNPDEQIFIFAHETCHIAFNHIERSKGKETFFWNLATDGVINQFLKRDGLKIIDGCVDIAEAINYDAEELYNKLLKTKQQSKETSTKSQNPNHDAGHDTHSMWKDAKTNENQSETELQQEIDKISKMGERNAFKKNLEEKRKELEDLKNALTKEIMKAGTSTNSKVRVIDNIGQSKPIIDWRYLLRETINYDADWSYQNACIENGIISANLEEYPIPETEIVLDTSSSIDKMLLKNFLRECKNILKHSKLKVGCFDTQFYGFNEIRCEKDIENMEFIGGGGTNFNVAVSAFTRRVENKIIFTDGEAEVPETPLDVIWIVFGNRKINPKGGKVIYINKDQLERFNPYEKVKVKNI